MQTRLAKARLENPEVARADEILRKCVHCGFCTATCPTYLVTGDERDSPRGRIWLIRDMLENTSEAALDSEIAPELDLVFDSETALDAAPDNAPDNVKAIAKTTGYHLDRCLTCLSCMTTCPSGVDYMHLVDIGRRHAARTAPKPAATQLFRRLLVGVLSRGHIAWPLLMLGWLARPVLQPFTPLMPKVLRALLEAIPYRRPRLDPVGRADKVFSPPDGERITARVALLAGCAQRAVDPDINAATIRVLNRLGVEVVVRKAASCCGALAHHSGAEEAAREAMTATIRTWAREKEYRHLDAIIVNTSGCGTAIKDYGDYFSMDSMLASEAAMISDMALDITEFLAKNGLGEVDKGVAEGVHVIYHSACSMQHGQQIIDLAQNLLRQAGFAVSMPQESHICCGAAGAYNILNAGLAATLKERKQGHINTAIERAEETMGESAGETTGGVIIAAGNIGCMNQLKGSKAPIVHTIELLDWATGGDMPRKLRGHLPKRG